MRTACLSAALYPFFFYLSKCDNFSGTGKLVRFFFFFIYSSHRCNDHLVPIIFDKIRWYSDLERLEDGKRKRRVDWIIVVKNNLEN